MHPPLDDAGVSATVDSAGPRVAPGGRAARFGGMAVAAVIVLQVSVPAVALLLPPPQRFGFQMYSGLGGVRVTVTDVDGRDAPFDAPQLVGELRPEIDWLPALPERVCEALPDAVRVRVEQSDRERTVECG